FTRAIELDPKFAPAWRNRGAAYCDHLGQPARAVTDFSRAIELEPKDAKTWHSRGIAYSKLCQHDKAVADYTKAIKLNPKYVSAWYNRGRAYASLGQYDKARADYQTVLKLAPAHAGAHDALAWLLATCPDAKLRDAGQAVELAKKAMQLAPQNGSYWQTLGVARYRAGDWKSAVAALNKSMELQKGGGAVDRLFLAMAHQKLGNHGQARQAYDQAVQWLE